MRVLLSKISERPLDQNNLYLNCASLLAAAVCPLTGEIRVLLRRMVRFLKRLCM